MALFQPTALFRGAEYITPEYLREHGIRALILDVDNTLTGHGSQQLPPAIAAWLQTMKESGVKLRVASNNMPGRVRPFAQKIGLPYRALWAVACLPRNGRAPLRGGPCGGPGFHRRHGRKPGRGANAAGAAHVP